MDDRMSAIAVEPRAHAAEVGTASATKTSRSNSRRGKDEKKESTRDVLLRVMVQTLDECGEPGVRLEKVLHDANASVSSMYHYFGNLGGLIEAAQIVRFQRTQMLSLDLFRHGVQKAATIDEFREAVRTALDHSFSDALRLPRAQRVNAAARSYQNNEHAQQLRDLQLFANKGLVEVLIFAQAKGFVPSHVDVEAAAAWFNATSYSRYFVEILDEPSIEERWDALISRFVFAVLELPQ